MRWQCRDLSGPTPSCWFCAGPAAPPSTWQTFRGLGRIHLEVIFGRCFGNLLFHENGFSKAWELTSHKKAKVCLVFAICREPLLWRPPCLCPKCLPLPLPCLRSPHSYKVGDTHSHIECPQSPEPQMSCLTNIPGARPCQKAGPGQRRSKQIVALCAGE